VCLVCNDQLTEVIIVFFSKKLEVLTRAALTTAGWCVVDYPASSIKWVVQSDHPVPGHMLPVFYATCRFLQLSTVLVSANWNYLKQMQLKMTFAFHKAVDVATIFRWDGWVYNFLT